MKRHIILTVMIILFLAGISQVVAIQGFSELTYEQKQFYYQCSRGECWGFMKDKDYSSYRACYLDCFQKAQDYIVQDAWCEDTDNGLDYKTQGIVTTNIISQGKEDYCYTWSSGKTALFEGRCYNNKYQIIQKNCAELGASYSCVAGACVKPVCEVTDVDNGAVSDYPGCAISCNEGYELEEGICVEAGCADTDGDGVCDEDEIFGCTGVDALNYNPLATEEDGSCEYNDAPVLEAIGNKEVNEGETLLFVVTATDDGNYLVFGAENLPEGANLEEQTFTWTPNYSQAGEYEVLFTVSDGELEDEILVTITVVDVDCVIPTDGMIINEDTDFCPGIYNLPNGIEVTKDIIAPIYLDCHGATLTGNSDQVGVLMSYDNDVTIKNCNLENYQKGISLVGSTNNYLQNNGFKNHAHWGVYLDQNSNNNEVLGNTFDTSKGISINVCDENLVQDNTLTVFENYAIKIRSGKSNQIIHNNLSLGTHGITIAGSTQSGFSENNTIEGNLLVNVAIGIDLGSYLTKNNAYKNNEIISSSDSGIKVFGESNQIKDNIISESTIGIHFPKGGSNSAKTTKLNLVTDNIITNNEDGIFLEGWFVQENIIENNVINFNNVGLKVGMTNDNLITGNEIKNNPIGIELFGGVAQSAHTNEFTGNLIENSNTAIKMGNLVNSNTFWKNNLVNNVNPVLPSGSNFWSSNGIGNYWSNYDVPEEGCEDLDNDGICDNSYIIDEDSQDNFPFTQPNGWE